MSRANPNRNPESRGKKAASRPAEGNGQPAAGLDPTVSADPAAFDAALDAFVSRAQREFSGASAATSIGKGTYHPATGNLPLRFLALGLILGLPAGLLLALAVR